MSGKPASPEGGDNKGGHGGGGGHRKKHGGHVEEHVNLERWLVSYADFMTLLFCLFTLLYAMSITDKAKVTEVAKSVTKALGMGGPYESRTESSKDLDKGDVFDGTEGVLDKSGKDIFPDLTYKRVARREHVAEPVDSDYSGGGKGKESAAQKSARAKMEQVADMVEGALSSTLGKSVAAQITVEVLPGTGVRITLPSAITFQSGAAGITSGFEPALKKIASILERVDNNVIIEGHTDNVPINSWRYPSNWELSTARATSVLHFLISSYQLAPRRFSASGYGEFHPLVPNDSAENREKNRRAVIIIQENQVRRKIANS